MEKADGYTFSLPFQDIFVLQVNKEVQEFSAKLWLPILEYFKKHNYQSNHPKSENIDHTEFKNDIQNIVVLEMAKSGHF